MSLPSANYQFINFYQNEKYFAIEIKRLDIHSTDKSKIYFWFLLDKFTQNLTKIYKLEFIRMGKYNRVFKNYYLIFNKDYSECRLLPRNYEDLIEQGIKFEEITMEQKNIYNVTSVDMNKVITNINAYFRGKQYN
jgi:hypothetical protein